MEMNTFAKTYNVLFLCSGNATRSIMAEALMTDLSEGKFKGYSAGSRPVGKVHPFALEKVGQTGYPPENLRSKSCHEFTGASAQQMDFIITVCDNVAEGMCPLRHGSSATAHWGFEDPGAVEGTDEEKRAAFARVFRQIAVRVMEFIESHESEVNKEMNEEMNEETLMGA